MHILTQKVWGRSKESAFYKLSRGFWTQVILGPHFEKHCCYQRQHLLPGSSWCFQHTSRPELLSPLAHKPGAGSQQLFPLEVEPAVSRMLLWVTIVPRGHTQQRASPRDPSFRAPCGRRLPTKSCSAPPLPHGPSG